ncbi:TPA: hypothetical protein L3J64_002264 [Escherichia coli]|nr:hypothetical protein [Escherichia coli]
MAIRRRRRMFILFAERKVGEQHGPAAQGVLAAVQTLREMNADNLRKVPADAPTAFMNADNLRKVPADAPTAFMNHGSLAAANRGVAEYELSE